MSYPANGQSIIIKGLVVDDNTGDPLAFANVILMDPIDSSMVKGGMTDIQGKFNLSSDPGKFIFRIRFVGFKPYEKAITLETVPEKDLGEIRLLSTETDLDEVLVEEVASMFESDIDKRRYNVENSIVAEGATASELLATLPSIQVDEEGSITMRGSGNVLIYINGRPSNLSGENTEAILSQFPVNSIKAVELITNPSSRYDASGVGGIINIILKKNERNGFNGQTNVSIGTRDKYAGGLVLNYGIEKVNFFSSYNYQNRKRFRKAEGKRVSNILGASPILDQDAYNEEVEISHLVRGGADFHLSGNSQFGIFAQGNFNQEDEEETLNQRSLNSQEVLDSLYVRESTEDESGDHFEIGLTYNLEMDTLGQSMYASVSYAKDGRSQVDDFIQYFFSENRMEVPGKDSFR
ncbi:TonB-dependent receptor [Echinicola jeungdonensis]|uniref:TonB-dependent receptor n=1 Tax=Echinicola jeungdonensis TaxID=709343 RepID=UPI0025B59A30|nr:TonB-dependent receptor [Echinicola jeungdonensis]MDN3669595.1 TonB-dependent receptor [Echinicola jeungdonensis]